MVSVAATRKPTGGEKDDRTKISRTLSLGDQFEEKNELDIQVTS